MASGNKVTLSRKAIRTLRLSMAVALVAVVALFPFREPQFAGKSRSFWLSEALHGPLSMETLDALRSLGPDAIIPLFNEAQSRDSKSAALQITLYEKLPNFLQAWFDPPESRQTTRDRACWLLNKISDSVKPAYVDVLLPKLIPMLAFSDVHSSPVVSNPSTFQATPLDTSVRALAAEFLAELGPSAEPAVPALMAALKDESWRSSSIYPLIPRALGRIGPGARAAIPALEPLLNSTNKICAFAAVEAIHRIAPGAAESAVPMVESCLADPDPRTRLNAARVHFAVWNQPEKIHPVLKELLHNYGHSERADVLNALGDLGPAARDVMVDIAQIALFSSDHTVTRAAEDALKKIAQTNSISPAQIAGEASRPNFRAFRKAAESK